MNFYKAITLTSIHIGSGQEYLRNLDFFVKNSNNKNFACILSIDKMLKFLDEKGIENYINYVKNFRHGDLYQFLSRDLKLKNLDEIIKRKCEIYGNPNANNKLKETLVNADHNPIIPGSSLKGAIRTCLANYLIDKNKNNLKVLVNKEKYKETEKQIMNKIFSDTLDVLPYQNVMRFLYVGDIEFQYETIVNVLDIINYTNQQWSIKAGMSSLVECIAVDCESEPFRIYINETLLQRALSYKTITADISYLNISNIFKIVNEQTKKLIEEEINFWSAQNFQLRSVFKYIEKLREIKSNIQNLKENEMIIRVGAYQGWHFITGGWIRSFLTQTEWTNLFRTLNKNRNVNFFPKTRKTDFTGEVFGFIKVTPA